MHSPFKLPLLALQSLFLGLLSIGHAVEKSESQGALQEELQKIRSSEKSDFACTLIRKAKVLKLERRKQFNVVGVMMWDVPGAAWEETIRITLSDDLNKKYKAEFGKWHDLLSFDKCRVRLEAVPAAVMEALKKWAPEAEWNSVADAQKKYKEKSLFKIEGRLGGKKIKAEIFEDGQVKKQDKLSQPKE